MTEKIEPSPDEIRNGWTAEQIAAYRAERERAQSAYILNTVDSFGNPARGVKRPKNANSKYRPHRWRG